MQNEDKAKLQILVDEKTLEVLDLIADEVDWEIEETASRILAHSIEKISELYRALFLATLGAEH